MPEFAVTSRGDHVALALTDDRASTASAEMDAQQTFGLIAQLLQQLEKLPGNPEQTIEQQKPCLISTNPGILVGSARALDQIGIIIKAGPLPPFEFRLTRANALSLSKELHKHLDVLAEVSTSA